MKDGRLWVHLSDQGEGGEEWQGDNREHPYQEWTRIPFDGCSQKWQHGIGRVPRTTVLFYQEADERETVPLLDWLDEVPKKAQAKCQAYLQHLKDFGHELRRPIADYLRNGIYELRPSYQGVRYRMLYFFPKPEKSKAGAPPMLVVVSHGLAKEGAVPEVEIDRAAERKRKFEANPSRHTFRPTLRR